MPICEKLLVLALGNLQIEGGALAVNHNCPQIQQLLAGLWFALGFHSCPHWYTLAHSLCRP